jgi:signal transduction histidine kinase/ABC-type nitrate/sulfonate/bicarbonate transport system substrate-binding protein/FixJ family two-component response regulator
MARPEHHRINFARLLLLQCIWLGSGAASAASELEPVTLQLRYYHQFQFAGYYAADYQGFYRDEGLGVEIKEYQPALDLPFAVSSGKADFAISASLLFKEWSEGQDLFLVAVIFQRSPFELLVHADSPYQSIQDILTLPKDQMAGPVGVMEPELWLTLKQLGQNPDSFFSNPKHPGDLERFARRGLSVVSAYATNEPLMLRRNGVETRALRMLPRKTIFPGDGLMCRGELWRKRPELVERFRRASLRGWAYALSHQEEVVDHILAKRHSQWQSVDRQHLLEEAAATVDLVDADRFPLGEVKPERMQLIAALLRDAGLPVSLPTELVYQEGPAPDRWLVWLGIALACGSVGLVGLALFSRRQQRSLTESKAHYLNLVNSAEGYVAFRMRMESDGRPCAEMASRSIVDILGHPLEYYQEDFDRFFAQLPEADQQRFKEELQLASERQLPMRCRFRLRHPKHAALRHLMVHATPTRTERGVFFDGIHLDITAEVQAETEREHLHQQLQLSQRNESLGLLASGVAHDFNNILSAIRGNAELIAPLVPAPGRHRLDRLFQAVDRASGLVRQILAYSGRGTVESRPLNLAEEISQIDALVKHALPAEVHTVLDIDREVPWVMFDPAQFQQVAVNLIVNAAESYQGRPGRVHVILDRDGGSVRLRVIDQGCGMDQATMARIFEPYFTTKEQGHGLGLAAVQGIIKGLGGVIHCASAPGKGTTFTIRLAPTKVQAPHYSQRTPPELPSANQYVLVVDDDELVREITVETLSSLGYACKQAAGGLACQAILRNERDSLCAMVIDCRMPDVDGLTILKELRASGDRLPVVLVSGMINSDNIGRELLDRRTRFLAKPYSQGQLSDAIDALFGSSHPRGDESSYTAVMVTDVIRQRQQEEHRKDGSGLR